MTDSIINFLIKFDFNFHNLNVFVFLIAGATAPAFGKKVVGKWIKLAVKRAREMREKYHMRMDAVEDLFGFFYYINISVKADVVRFEPVDWMAWATMNIFGLYRSKGSSKRVFRYSTIWVARKSAKTTLAAILTLYAFMKGDRDAEAYVLANTKSQASQALKYAKSIINVSPALKKRARIRQYDIVYEGNGTCLFTALPNEPDRLDGLKPSVSVIDEKHAMKTNDLFNIMKTGMLASSNPLLITISTAGFDRDVPFYNELDIGRRVLLGEETDDSTFYAFYTLDEGDDIEDTNMWYKSNPSLGTTVELEDMILDFEKAKLSLSDKLNFIVKNLNVYSDSDTTWIPDAAYRKCFIDPNLEALKGRKAYIGLDLSAARDLASLTVVVEGDDGKLNVIPEFYFPTIDNEQNKIRSSGIDLSKWIDAGYITPHKGKVIDQDAIIERIKYYNGIFDLQGVSYDQWNATVFVNKVEAQLLVDTYVAPQNTSYFNFPLKLIERLIFDEQINLSRSPVMRWNFRNVVLYRDGNGNIKIVKNKSKDSVDGAVSLAMAVGLYAKLNFDSVSMLMDSFNQEYIGMEKQ